jgi:hypothetical protein
VETTSTSARGGHEVIGQTIYEPFVEPDGPEGYFSYPSPECEQAAIGIASFQYRELAKIGLLEALDALPGDVPVDVLDAIDSFEVFREEFFEIAKALDDKYGFAANYEARIADPDYLRMVAALETGVLDALNRLSAYVEDVCPSTYHS